MKEPCSKCGSVEYRRLTIFFTKEGRIEECGDCPSKHSPTPLFGRMIKGALGLSSKGKRTAAHDADISRRKTAPDGSIYRDYGRKSFVIP